VTAQFLVLAKAPVPGRVKTRLCPPCTPEQAARIAAAALADTIDTVAATPAARRTLVLDGDHPRPSGWWVRVQRGGSLSERLANAFADTRRPGVATVLVGMDTPQLTPTVLTAAAHLVDVDATLGPAVDGGWWVLGLRDSAHAALLADIPTSTATTGADTLAALRRRGLRVALLPRLRDVDTITDLRPVVAACPPGSRFVAAVRDTGAM
jgi:rSAM/selenodomain-associated transferase 1